MSHRQNTVEGAIRRSISHDEIVTVECDEIPEAFAELTSDQGDYDYVDTTADNGPEERPAKLREVWGKDDDGDYWRVHLLQRA